MAIKIDDLSREIMQQLEIYTNNVVDGISEVGEKVSKDGAKRLKSGGPSRTGKYVKGWAVKRVKTLGKPTEYILYNKTRYQISHLLEFGHATRSGGRTKPIPHIKPVEKDVVDAYLKGVEEVIKNG